jgi:hypothetical protein
MNPTNPPQRTRRWARLVYSLAALATLIALFYAVENWRGRRAWEACKRDLEARHLPTDWTPPKLANIPEDQNFADTPFLKSNGYKSRRELNGPNPNPLSCPGLALTTRMVDMGELLDLTECQNDLREMTNLALPPLPREPALDVIDAFRPIEAVLNELRAASLRPHSAFVIQGNDPIDMDMPNFVVCRSIAQILWLHSGAELALGHPEEAFRDQLVVHRLSEALKSSDTLVSTMIRVAIMGLNTSAFWQGWARNQWTAPQLEKFQQLFHQVDLLSDLNRSFRDGELAAFNFLLNHYSPPQLIKVFNFSGSSHPAFHASTWFIYLAPQGWRLQNQVRGNRTIMGFVLDTFDPFAQRVFPGAAKDKSTALEKLESHVTPYNYIVRGTVPNVIRALQTTARNQSQVSEAEIVCALERYRLQKGNYPESLEPLTPTFIEKLPHDIVTGKPLHYHQTPDGKFMLYSVGWNEKDDGGASSADKLRGDWVWPMVEK